MKPILIPFAAAVSVAAAAPDGAALFTANCSACHLPDQMLVGPSLAEIRTLYNGKPDEFVKWCVAPKKKRPNAVDMPSQVHVGDEGLRAIYKHIMEVSKGLVEKKQEKGDPYAAAPAQSARPQVMRIFMPDAGPASIAVALDQTNSLCWDAGSCRLRYAWTGGFIDGFPYWKGNGSSVAAVNGTVKYVEASSPFGKDAPVKFQGYGIKDGLPVFKYSVNDRQVSESYAPIGEGEGFKRTFSITPKSEAAPIVLDFPAQSGVSITSDKGKLEGGKLTLTPQEAAAFTLSFSLK